jgi:nucleoside-diphosphate-sugar epimerase
VARILIVGGGCRGRRLAAGLIDDGHAVRITTRAEQGRAAIEQVGAQCWIGTPDRLATLRGALDGVTVLCWLLGGASGSTEELTALYTTRLEFFLTQAIDTTVRGFIYEAASAGTPPELLSKGEQIVVRLTARNEIPVRFLRADPAEDGAWLAEAQGAVGSLLGMPA